MGKKLLLIVLPIIITVLLSSCKLGLMSSVYNNDEKIVGESNTFSLGEVDQEIAKNTIKAKNENIEGMETIWSFTAEEDMDIEFSGEIFVLKGKAKLVYIYPDNSLFIIAEEDNTITEDNTISQTVTAKKGLNRIKLVAKKDTELGINLLATAGKFQKLGIDW